MPDTVQQENILSHTAALLSHRPVQYLLSSANIKTGLNSCHFLSVCLYVFPCVFLPVLIYSQWSNQSFNFLGNGSLDSKLQVSFRVCMSFLPSSSYSFILSKEKSIILLAQACGIPAVVVLAVDCFLSFSPSSTFLIEGVL